MGAWDGTSIHGVSFNPGEVPLVAGQTYFIEIRLPTGGVVNPFYMEASRYDHGQAYRLIGSSWVALPSDDLHMTIVEYMPRPSSLKIQPDVFSHILDRDSNLPPDTFTITNTGDQSICYTAAETTSWLGISRTTGCLGPGASHQVTIDYATANLPNGEYQGTIAIEDPDTLAQAVTVSLKVVTAPGDLDEDGDVDQDDFGILQACLSGAGIPQTLPHCQSARLDGDDDVDQDDVAILYGCFSGPNIRADRHCAAGN